MEETFFPRSKLMCEKLIWILINGFAKKKTNHNNADLKLQELNESREFILNNLNHGLAQLN